MTTMTDRQRDGVEKFGRAVPFAGLGTSISGEMNGIGISDRIRCMGFGISAKGRSNRVRKPIRSGYFGSGPKFPITLMACKENKREKKLPSCLLFFVGNLKADTELVEVSTDQMFLLDRIQT